MTPGMGRKPMGLGLCMAALALFAPAAAGIEVFDDTGATVQLETPAQRIVSLAPHVTELLFAAGAGNHVVGVVSYSDYPAAARAIARVGGYQSLDLEAIVALHPDLVVGWQSGNHPGHLDRLRALGISVYLTEPRQLQQVADNIRRLGRLAGTDTKAAAAADAFMRRVDGLRRRHAARPTLSVFYEVWNQPLMTVNGAHLISEVIHLCGGQNAFGDLDSLVLHIDTETVLQRNPDVILASGMDEERPQWLDEWRDWPQLAAVQGDRLLFIPPDLLQRATPRILDGAARLCRLMEQARQES